MMSKKQWIGLTIVLLMIAMVELCCYWADRWQAAQPAPELFALQPEREQAFLRYLDSLDAANQAARRAQYAAKYPKHTVILQPFDPNTADSTLLVTVGLKPYMARNLIRYRNAGKVFRQPDDLRHLYGMTDSLYTTLQPYIQIDSAHAMNLLRAEQMTNHPLSDSDSSHAAYVSYPKRDTILDLNSADTTELMLLRGIGRTTAARIIRYRRELGGYYTVNQLYEIGKHYHIQAQIPDGRIDSLLPFLYADTTRISPIRFNGASVKRLYNHPYISYSQAEQLYDLRRRRIRVNSLHDLAPVLSPEERNRLRPYLSFE